MTEDPTGDLLPEIRQKYKDRYPRGPEPAEHYYFFLNETMAPFDKLEARQAVNYAIDSNALVRVFGGRLEPGCTFLPPDVEGYKEYECPYGDPNGPGDIAKAKQLVEEVRHEGPDGHGVDQQQGSAPGDRRVLRRHAERDRLQGEDQDAGPAGLLRQDRDQVHQGPDRLHGLVPGLPAPGGLLPAAAERGRRSSRHRPATRASSRTPSSTRRSRSSTEEPDLDEGQEPVGRPGRRRRSRRPTSCPTATRSRATFFSERMDFENCAGVHPVWKNDWSQFCLK